MVKSLSDNDFKYLSQEFSRDLLKLIKQKGVYPYEYMHSFEKFSEDKLLDKCKFYSSLKDECISEKDNLHAIDALNVFKMNIMGDYHDLYLKAGILLLVVFEKLISTCLDYYRSNPCHYFSSSRLSWDAMVKMTGIELEFILHIDMHLFIEKGMGGDISYIAKRHSKANSKCMKCYDSKESKFIMYLDANNLYGWAMNQYLPYSGFKWLNQKEIDKFCLNSIECSSIEENSPDGYILEFELEYPDEL